MNIPQFIYGANDDLQRYFALLVQQLQMGLTNQGWTLPVLTQTQVTEVINGTVVPYFSPVMPIGTIWFNSSSASPNGKIQVITVAAVPGTSNAVIETVTSA